MKNKIVIGLIAILLATTVHAANKKSKPGDYIKYRQSAMMFMRWNMGVIKKHVIKNPENFNREEVLAAAKVLSSIAASNLNKLYPDNTASGTGWKSTRVKSEYFYNADDVAEKTFKLIKESNKLVEVAENSSPDLIRAQFKNTLKSCKSCHKAYRAKK